MPDQKRILILTADAGYGHRSAANAIAAALQETHGGECTHEIINVLDHEHTPAFLRDTQTDYDRVARERPEFHKFGYEATDNATPKVILDRGLQVMLYSAMRRVLHDTQPDIIVSTYPLYQAALGAVFSITGKFIPLITVITDLITVHQIWFSEYSDLTVVPTSTVRDLALEAGLPAERVEVIGIPVQPRLSRQMPDKAALRAELDWEPDLTTVLIVSSKRSTRSADVIHVLNHSGLPIQLVLVAGGDDESYAQLQQTEWHRPAHIYNFVKNMPDMMCASDVIVCKAGGLTVTESLACGLPLLLTDVIPGQETGNAQYVIEGGAGAMIDEPLHALEILCHLLVNEGGLLKERAANALRLGRPRAAYDIVDRAWQLMQQGPVVKEASQIPLLPRLLELFRQYDVVLEEA
jgi:1,2-diacylglycerol 3-beta-galactosyltransferase